MPSITITAVSTGADTFTVTAHNMLTGDRFRLRNINGALPAATPSLAAVTDYFAIVVDANTVKVATSSANATGGIAVDITGSGTGTSFVEYGLPYCAPTAAAAPLTQIKSANDTAAWAALVALYGLLTGQAQSIWSGITLAGGLTVGGVLSGPLTLGAISPALVSGNNNDFNPAGMPGAVVIFAAGVATAAITGMAGGVNGRLVFLINAGGFATTIPNEDSNSSAANRFSTPGGTTLTLTGSSNFATLWLYDGASNRWRMMAKNF